MSLLCGPPQRAYLAAGRRVAAASSSSHATSSEPPKAGEDVQQQGEIDERDEPGYPAQPPRQAVIGMLDPRPDVMAGNSNAELAGIPR